MNMLLSFWFLAIALSSVQSARILAVLPLGAKSHQRFLQAVTRTLAQAEHEVLIYSPFPHLLGDPPANVTHVHLEAISVTDQSNDMLPFIQEITDYPFYKCMDIMWTYSEGLYEEFISDKAIKKLLASDKHFDLIITETFNAQEFTLMLSHMFKAPVIGLQAFPTNNIVNFAQGNSLSISYIPDTCSKFSNKMTLIERAVNALTELRGLYFHYNYYIPKLETRMRQDFPNMPPLQELMTTVSLMFVNDHLTADYSQPRPPNIIPVGGIHIEQPQPLPKAIQEFMDNATDGVIFFSLGTYVPDDLKPQEYFETFINVFKKQKQKVLWKTRKTNIEGLPDNVMTVQWAPQKDILAHPASVLFITHGGQLSLLEALQFGVPVVSIPQFFDQNRNSEFYVRNEVGVKISMKDVSEETMSASLHTVLNNSSYRENMKRLSAIFRDRPLSPAESVVYWTEYVMRHGGASHLRPASTELHWYQAVMLDVFALVSFISIILLIVLYVVSKRIVQFILRIKHIKDIFGLNLDITKKVN